MGPLTIGGGKYLAGIAYIAIPSDVDRDTYLADCYSNLQVCLMTEDGGFHNRCPIPTEVLNFVTFPTTPGELGSAIIYVTEQLHQQMVVVGRLQIRSEMGDGRENQFKLTRRFNGAMVEVSGSPVDRVLNLVVDGSDASGAINIRVINLNQDAELNVDVAGDVNVNASGSQTYTQQKQYEVTTTDSESDNDASFKQTSTENKFYNQKLTVNDGTDPLVRGKELKSLLSDFIDEVAKITTATAIGTQPILNATQITAFKDRLDDILSTVCFTDK